jgi:rhodanese-related sulfurtransferase
MKKITLMLGLMALLFTGVLSAQIGAGNVIVTLDKTAFKAKLAKKSIQLVDVRTPAEFTLGHIEGAANLNVNDAQFKDLAAKLDKRKPVAVYCKAGSRSAKAAGILAEMGFKTIYNLDGGYMAWTSN